jgi:hypothetical protein
MLFDFDEDEYAALVGRRWPARVAAIGVLVSLMAAAGTLWTKAVIPPSPQGEWFDVDSLVAEASVAMAVIEGVFLFLTWRPPRSRLVGFAAAVVLVVPVVFVFGEVVGIVKAYLRI